MKLDEEAIKVDNVKVVTLIGSSKQKEDYEYVNERLTRLGYAVFSLGVWSPPDKESIRPTLERVHMKKIKISDIVVAIMQPDELLGKHASEELEYAKKLKKEIWQFNVNRKMFYYEGGEML